MFWSYTRRHNFVVPKEPQDQTRIILSHFPKRNGKFINQILYFWQNSSIKGHEVQQKREANSFTLVKIIFLDSKKILIQVQ